MSVFKSKKILVLMTGSIAAYKVCHILSRLKQQGHQVRVVMSQQSLHFIGPVTIEGLTGEPPYTNMYAVGHVMEHIQLMRWADLILVAPATANFINKIAHGVGDDFLSSLFLAHDFQKPFLIAPAMNTKMYEHPTTKESVERLKKMKIDILETASGVLACGEIGSGRLLDPDLILTEIDQALEVTIVQNSNDKLIPFGQKSVLITSGGTTEPIDDVRVITNRSTGRTAAKLADSLTALGLSVTYLHSENAVKPLLSCELISYNDFQSLQKHLESLTKENFYHTIFHAAAVSDYSVIPYLGKINSDLEEIQITLKKNPKLIDSIKKWAPQSQLVGFKLTSQLDDNSILAKVQNLFKNSSCDYVIQNDWNDVRNRNEKYRIYKKHSSPHYEEIKSTEELHAVVTQILLTQEQL